MGGEATFKQANHPVSLRRFLGSAFAAALTASTLFLRKQTQDNCVEGVGQPSKPIRDAIVNAREGLGPPPIFDHLLFRKEFSFHQQFASQFILSDQLKFFHEGFLQGWLAL